MSSSLGLFISAHSLLRYIVILCTLAVAAQSLIGLLGKKQFGAGNRKVALMMMISCDIQLLLGLAVFYLGGHMHTFSTPGGMHDRYSRFYAMEHPMSMIIGIVLVHVGYSIAKKNMDNGRKFMRLFWCSFIALFIFVAMTPWPSKQIVGKPFMAAVTVSH